MIEFLNLKQNDHGFDFDFICDCRDDKFFSASYHIDTDKIQLHGEYTPEDVGGFFYPHLATGCRKIAELKELPERYVVQWY